MCFDWTITLRKVCGNAHMLLIASRDTKVYFRYDKQRNASTSTPHMLSTTSRRNREEKLRAERHGNRKNNK